MTAGPIKFKRLLALLPLLFIALHTLLPAKHRPGHPPAHFHQISLDQGLSQVTVNTILQDNRGFMWIGTQDGLNRYNGYECTIFRPEDNNPLSLRHITINVLYEDRNGRMWVGTNGGGLSRFDRDTETFKHFISIKGDESTLGADYIGSILQDKSGTLWIGTLGGGLNRYDAGTSTFKRYMVDPEDFQTLRNNSISTLAEDSAGNLWAGTWGAYIHRWDKKNGKCSFYEIPQENGTGSGGTREVTVIHEDKSGNFWVGAVDRGLFIMDRENGSFTRVLFEHQDEDGGAGSEEITPSGITSLMETESGDIWVGTGTGLFVKHKGQDTWLHYRHDRDHPKSLRDDVVKCLYKDRSGMVWVGTRSTGVNLYKDIPPKFSLYRKLPNDNKGLSSNLVRAIVEDNDGTLWIGTTGGGLNHFDKERKHAVHYLPDNSAPGSLGGSVIQSLLVDTRGALWVGTMRAGLHKFDRSTGHFTQFSHKPGDPDSLSYDYVSTFKETRNGEFWVGTWGGGLNHFDRDKEIFTLHQDNRHFDRHAKANENIGVIHEDRRGTLWLGTINGLTRFDRRSGHFYCYCQSQDTPLSLKQQLVTSIYEDSQGMLWFGSLGGGLNRLDLTTNTFQVYKEKDGLPNNVVYGILGDRVGNLWLSSNKGLTKFNPRSGHFRNFDTDDGLQSNEFNAGAIYISQKGEMFFGGVNGFNSFFPDKIKDNPYIPPVYLTGFKVFNRKVPIGPKDASPLRKSIIETTGIELQPDQSVFTFEFSALSFVDSRKNQYAFILENFEKEWNQVGTLRRATYTNLDAGEYIFRVKGANNDQVWNHAGASVKLIVRPTFWNTWWAYGVYIVVLALFLVGLRQLELSRERARVRMRETELRAQAAEAQSRALQAEHMRKTHELEEARKLQLSMLPKDLPDIPALDIAVYMETATEVGGDYYDFQVDEDGTLVAAVGDATGHGLKAGTMVSVIKGLFCSETSHRNITAFFRRCTHTIRMMCLGNLYMALTLLTINKENRLRISSAGMPPAYLFRAADNSLETINIKQPPLGAFSELTYKSREFSLSPGDTLLLLSDGMPELFNPDEEMYGYRQVGKLFHGIAQKDPPDILKHLEKTYQEWLQGKTPDDDITFVVIKLNENT